MTTNAILPKHPCPEWCGSRHDGHQQYAKEVRAGSDCSTHQNIVGELFGQTYAYRDETLHLMVRLMCEDGSGLATIQLDDPHRALVELLPSEARSLAAMLLRAAEALEFPAL